MSEYICDDREDYRDWINNLIENMSDEEKAEYHRKMARNDLPDEHKKTTAGNM